MAKPLNEFGGWLRFFQITCWLNLIASLLAVVLFTVTAFGGPLPAAVESLVIAADAGVTFWFLRKILGKMTTPAKESAVAIEGWLKILLFCAAGFLGLELAAALWKHAWAWSEDATDLVKSAKSGLGWPALWLVYFQKAQRVKVFYGGAAPVPAPVPASPSAPLEPS